MTIPEKQKKVTVSRSEEIMILFSGSQRHFIKEIFNCMEANTLPKITQLTSGRKNYLNFQLRPGSPISMAKLSLWLGAPPQSMSR